MKPTHRGDPHVLTITRILTASRQAVFDAWTNAESVRQWMCPGDGSVAVAELDVRVGGTFRVDMIVDGERTVHTGIYQEVRPPEKLVFTWTSKRTQQIATLVTVELRALGVQTELTLTQTRLPDEGTTQMHTRGWILIMERLADFLQSGQSLGK
ncbi:MAG TPA: SRPBCC domain-containing protein [Ktedonobacterales bacterium]|nr:SRPBCC domain-containing protein [Ktedonobacterales bacterium]